MLTELITKKRKIALLKRVAVIAADKIIEMKGGEYNYKEICAITGIEQSRLTDLTKHGQMNEKTFSGLLAGGFLKVKDILKKLGNLTEAERNYLNTFRLYEDKELRDLIGQADQKGLDVKKLIKQKLGT